MARRLLTQAAQIVAREGRRFANQNGDPRRFLETLDALFQAVALEEETDRQLGTLLKQLERIPPGAERRALLKQIKAARTVRVNSVRH